MGIVGKGKWLARWIAWYSVIAFVGLFVFVLFFLMDAGGWPTMAAVLLWLFVGIVLYAVLYPVYTGIVKPLKTLSGRSAQ